MTVQYSLHLAFCLSFRVNLLLTELISFSELLYKTTKIIWKFYFIFRTGHSSKTLYFVCFIIKWSKSRDLTEQLILLSLIIYFPPVVIATVSLSIIENWMSRLTKGLKQNNKQGQKLRRCKYFWQTITVDVFCLNVVKVTYRLDVKTIMSRQNFDHNSSDILPI